MNLTNIKLIVLDVDGTMTDGSIYLGSDGSEIKKFNTRDGLGIVLAQSVGFEFMVITGRISSCVEQRVNELHIKYLAQGIGKKAEYLKNFIVTNKLLSENIVYIGDDLNDLSAMQYAGISACPADATDEIKKYCDLVLPQKGGEGVIRAFIEILLKDNKMWEKAIKNVFS